MLNITLEGPEMKWVFKQKMVLLINVWQIIYKRIFLLVAPERDEFFLRSLVLMN